MPQSPLMLTFDPNTIGHLGYSMYSHLPNALAEVIANAYDADATEVQVVIDESNGRSVTVVDNGHGMSLDDLNEKYLRIGRNRRSPSEGSDPGRSESGRRMVAGKKGLGKLALFGIGTVVELRTKREGASAFLNVRLDWNEIRSANGQYRPEFDIEAGPERVNGTTVRIRNLKRSTAINPDKLALSLSRLFGYLDGGFELIIVGPDGRRIPVTRDAWLADLDSYRPWRIPEDLTSDLQDRMPDPSIRGVIYGARKPIPADRRGIALYARGRLANEPEFFGVPTSSHAVSYLIGSIDVDYIDEGSDDQIATDRRAVSWDTDQTSRLHDFLESVVRWSIRMWRNERAAENARDSNRRIGISEQEWLDTVRGPSRALLRGLLDAVNDPESGMPPDTRADVVERIERIMPPYPELHWRNLHQEVRIACEREYKDRRYHDAVRGATIRYFNRLRSMVSDGDTNERARIELAFGSKAGELDPASKYQPGGMSPTTDTVNNIRDAQWGFARGVLAGFRNPLSHEEVRNLVDSGLLTDSDCLDALSLLSHMHRRLDDCV